MSNRINNPYKLTDDENVIIKSYFVTHEDWEKDVFNVIKTNIRDFLRQEQDNKCCYCKKELGYDIKEVDIEHIIPKATFNSFTFEPLNLALSCPGCNTIKGDKNVLARMIKRYPKHSKYINIIHPHFDNYEDHIVIHNGCVFEPLSTKGSHTITVCELFRLKIVEKKAKAIMSRRISESQLVKLIKNASKEELTEALIELMKRIK